jgi:AraC-like DNA-binding protein
MRINTRAHWQDIVDRAIAISDNHLSIDLPLKAVADQLSVDEQTLGRHFELCRNESFKQFTKRRKLENAGGLLRHSAMGVGQIAELCGYNTIHSFSKAFDGFYGISPKAFRDMPYLPNESTTLDRTRAATSSAATLDEVFNIEKTTELQATAATLYYTILPSQHDPIRNMMQHMKHYISQFNIIKAATQLPEAPIITGTRDAVPVTAYEHMMMYVGLLVPKEKGLEDAHQRIRRGFPDCRLLEKDIPACNYKHLKADMGFAEAGLPMYNFINSSCRASHFKMSSNRFFLSLTGADTCEAFIPWERRYGC